MENAPNLVVIGSSNTDLVVATPTLPRPGETVLGGDLLINQGGKGANQAAAAARLGATVRLVARIGSDTFGDQAQDILGNFGIDMHYVAHDPAAPTGVALIAVGPDGQNQIVVAPGANAHLSPADIDHARPAFEEADLVVCQFETPIETVNHAMDLCHELGKMFLLNPAPMQPGALSPERLSRIGVLVPNETEAALLLGRPVDSDQAALEAARELVNRGVGTAIITLGSRGVVAASHDQTFMIPAYKVTAVDATAAGDCFVGALAFCLARGKPLPEALRFATAAAALSVTRAGAQRSLPVRQEVEAFLAG